MEEKLLDKMIDFVMDTTYESLPAEEVESALIHVSDFIGCMVAGADVESSKRLYSVLREYESQNDLDVPIFEGKIPAPFWAAVVSTMGRAHDFDDVHEGAVTHVGVGTIPALLAASKKNKLSGRDFIKAVVVSYDLLIRLCLACSVPPGKSGMNNGYHAATLVSALLYGYLTGCDKATLKNAMGIAFCEVSGTDQCLVEGTSMVAVEQGLSSAKGINAVDLAKAGLTGPHDIFTGKDGYYKTFQHGQYDLDRAFGDLGQNYHGSEVSIKLYPCCKFTHSCAEGIFEILGSKRYQADEIDAVNVGVSKQAFNIAYSIDGDHLKTSIDAKFCLPYIAAVAILKGDLRLEDFDQDFSIDEETKKLIRKVNIFIDPEIEEKYGNIISPSTVEIHFTNGEVKKAFVEYVKGHPRNKININEVFRKLHKCLNRQEKTSDINFQSGLEDTISNLASIEDVSELLDKF